MTEKDDAFTIRATIQVKHRVALGRRTCAGIDANIGDDVIVTVRKAKEE